jgi:hypothetical protein
MESAAGELPIKNYYENLNNFIAYAYHMVNVFSHTPPVISSMSGNREKHVRLWTIGKVDMEKNEEKMFFPLDKPSDKCYYYAIHDKRLETDGQLLNRIRKQVKSKSENGTACSYAIHSTTYDEDMVFVACWSSQVQAFPEHYQSL